VGLINRADGRGGRIERVGILPALRDSHKSTFAGMSSMKVVGCTMHMYIHPIVTRGNVELIPVNPLKTKRRLLYLKTQSVQRCKHILSRL
jgi:hypothetical protein